MHHVDEILTYYGVWMDPFNPKPEQIRIDDITHALSKLTRANGHIDRFYSVAQHSMNCEKEAAARGYSRVVRLFCLLHDASECYLSDITRPIKSRLPDYIEAEKRLQGMIFETLCGVQPTQEEAELVRKVDDCLLQHEFIKLRGVKVFDETPCMAAACDFATANMDAVRIRFLSRYRELAGG